MRPQTNKQLKREQRRRDKESRRRQRQQCEWKRQRPQRRERTTEELLAELKQFEAKERTRRNNLATLGMAAALIAMAAAPSKGNLP
jgi:hypothetical protein